MVDPTHGCVGSFPAKEDDLFIAAQNSHVLGFDNLSKITKAQSDMLCRLVTQGVVFKRKLYSDADEVVLVAQSPVILTSIADVVSQHDLLSRSLLLELPVIPEEKRQEEEEVVRVFHELHPRLLGLLLDGVVSALKARAEGRWNAYPCDLDRLPDFQRWALNGMEGLGLTPEGLLNAYAKCRQRADDQALDANVLASAILAFMQARGSNWPAPNAVKGAKDLYAELQSCRACQPYHSHTYWPKDHMMLGRYLSDATATLRAQGIILTRDNKRVRTKGPRPNSITIVDTNRADAPPVADE